MRFQHKSIIMASVGIVRGAEVDAARYLASDEAAIISGVCIEVDWPPRV